MDITKYEGNDAAIERIDATKETMELHGQRCLRIAIEIGADEETIEYYTERAADEDLLLKGGVAVFDQRTTIKDPSSGEIRPMTDQDIEHQVRTRMMHNQGIFEPQKNNHLTIEPRLIN